MALEIPFQVGDKTLFITSGDKSYEISEERMIKAPGATEATLQLCPIKWYGNLEGVYTAALNMKIRASDARSFDELQQVIKDCTAQLRADFAIVTPPAIQRMSVAATPVVEESPRRTRQPAVAPEVQTTSRRRTT